MKKHILPPIILIALLLTSCEEKKNAFETLDACIAEQKKKFGKEHTPGDNSQCVERFMIPKETNPYLQ